MTTSLRRTIRKLRPWLVGWFAFQAVFAVVGRLMAWRVDEGDESSTNIRRVVTVGGLELHPRNPQLSRMRVDLGMAGAELDLTAIPRPATGVDLTVRVLMGGLSVRVPSEWRVWWEFRGVGGIGSDGGVQRTPDKQSADLRVHAVVLLGGIGVEASG